ncbi:MAG: tRNA pseudouridine(55) synthase TruB [Chloroflexia bacterium]
MIDGIFIIDKSEGMTSHDVVSKVRRIIRQKRVGHAGTLDPMATGVLPVVVGRATRLVEYLAEADKAYRTSILLGATSDTYDREGVITATPDAVMPSPAEVERALDAFRGEIEQVPPMHSALKIGGQKLYDLARQGIEVERQARHINITWLEIEAYVPPHLQVFVECSKGTYIRSLAFDLGEKLGTGALLEGLIRTRVAGFTLDDATTLEGLEAAFAEGTWQESLKAPESILAGWEIYSINEATEKAILQGKAVELANADPQKGSTAAVRGQDGGLLAVVEWNSAASQWQPRKVFGA